MNVLYTYVPVRDLVRLIWSEYDCVTPFRLEPSDLLNDIWTILYETQQHVVYEFGVGLCYHAMDAFWRTPCLSKLVAIEADQTAFQNGVTYLDDFVRKRSGIRVVDRNEKTHVRIVNVDNDYPRSLTYLFEDKGNIYHEKWCRAAKQEANVILIATEPANIKHLLRLLRLLNPQTLVVLPQFIALSNAVYTFLCDSSFYFIRNLPACTSWSDATLFALWRKLG